MSSTYTLCFFSLFLLSAAASAATTPAGFLLPILKDKARLQYYTTFNLGTPPVRIYYSVDLNNPTNWFVGPLTAYNQSSSYHTVTINTTDCTAYSGPEAAYDDCSGAPTPICNHNQCNGWTSNPIYSTDSYWSLGPVVEDLLAPLYNRRTLAKASIPRFPFVYTLETSSLKGLSQYVKGIVSLARNPMAIHSQISTAFKIPRKFALCLPTSTANGVNGAVYFGGGPYVLPPSAVDLSGSMAFISLVSNSHSVMNAYEPNDPGMAYFIKITSIQIDGTPVRFNTSLLSIDARGDGGTKLSTMDPYTKLDSQIYPAFVAAFVEKAKAMNITVAGPVSSFKTCFNSASIKYNSRTGSGLPVIDLVMAGSSKWRIYGSNSMVKVSSDVQCLAFFEAGPKSTAFRSSTPSIVIGGKQMEDNLVEFDLEASKYYTSFKLGTPAVRLYLSVDIGNPTNWIVGHLAGYTKSSSYYSVNVKSAKCTAYSGYLPPYSDCTKTPSPICNRNQCNGWASNPLRLDPNFDHGAYGLDPIVEDVISPLYRRGTLSKAALLRFPFVDTAAKGPLTRLSQYTKGIVSLGKTPMALHSQISSAYKLPRKFAICLPSSTSNGVNGLVYFGGGPYVLPPSTVDLSKLMVKTPLVSNSKSYMNAYEPADPAMEYYIKINSVQIDGAAVRLNSSLLSIDGRGDGGTKLSTMVHYTKLHSAIYSAVVDVFVRRAKAMNIKVARPVGSFKTCFYSSSIKYNSKTGSGLPVIELVMAGNSKWRIYGSNSMVKVTSDVQCLAIVDAGPKPAYGVSPAIVIGGKQMEDTLVEFDLQGSRIGIASSLKRFGTSCSQFKGI
ncbi:hypothetical protein V2J09_023123 [Rumex salicifolius]